MIYIQIRPEEYLIENDVWKHHAISSLLEFLNQYIDINDLTSGLCIWSSAVDTHESHKDPENQE